MDIYGKGQIGELCAKCGIRTLQQPHTSIKFSESAIQLDNFGPYGTGPLNQPLYLANLSASIPGIIIPICLPVSA